MRAPPLSLLANVFSITVLRFWQAGLHLAITPIYIRLLGPEAYGLVAFNATLVLTVMSLDQLGTPTFIREVGRLGLTSETAPRIHQLLHNLERLALAMGLVIAVSLFALAPFFARTWFPASTFPVGDIETAVRLMALSLVCQWPSFLYSGGFVAIHRQDLLSIIRGLIATAQTIGGALILWLVTPAVWLLLAWYAGLFLVQSVACRTVLWRLLPSTSERPRFDFAKLRPIWRLALGTCLISLTG